MVMVLRKNISDIASQQDLRIAALKLLTVIPEVIRYDILHPLKSSVVHGLERALDDPKRAVRRQAVDARCVFMYF